MFLHHLGADVAKALLLGPLVVKLCEDVKEEIGVAGYLNHDRKLAFGDRELERSAIKFHKVTKGLDAVPAIALGIDDLPFIERNAAQMRSDLRTSRPVIFAFSITWMASKMPTYPKFPAKVVSVRPSAETRRG